MRNELRISAPAQATRTLGRSAPLREGEECGPDKAKGGAFHGAKHSNWNHRMNGLRPYRRGYAVEDLHRRGGPDAEARRIPDASRWNANRTPRCAPAPFLGGGEQVAAGRMRGGATLARGRRNTTLVEV